MRQKLTPRQIQRRLYKYTRFAWRVFNRSREGRQDVLEVFDEMIKTFPAGKLSRTVRNVKEAFLKSEVER